MLLQNLFCLKVYPCLNYFIANIRFCYGNLSVYKHLIIAKLQKHFSTGNIFRVAANTGSGGYQEMVYRVHYPVWGKQVGLGYFGTVYQHLVSFPENRNFAATQRF